MGRCTILLGLVATFLVAAVTHAQRGPSHPWKRADVGTAASFRGLSVVSGDVVWASGTQGTVIRTVDSGKTWDVQEVAGAENRFSRDSRV